MDRFYLDLGYGILVKGKELAAVIPTWLVEWDIETSPLPGVPTCFVELESGRVVPCFKPAEEVHKFILDTSRGLGTW